MNSAGGQDAPTMHHTTGAHREPNIVTQEMVQNVYDELINYLDDESVRNNHVSSVERRGHDGNERRGHEDNERRGHEDNERRGHEGNEGRDHEVKEGRGHEDNERRGHEGNERRGHEGNVRRDHEDNERRGHEEIERRGHEGNERRGHEGNERHGTSSPRQHADYLKIQLTADKSRGKPNARTLMMTFHELCSDLTIATDSYVLEFVKEPLNGLALLVRLLFKIQGRKTAMQGSARSNQHNNYKQIIQEEEYCLKCIKGCIQFVSAIPRLFKERNAIETIAYSALSHDNATSLAAVQVLILSCDSPRSCAEMMKAHAALSSRMGDSLRFSGLIARLNQSMHIEFMTGCLRLFNTLWEKTESSNGRIYLQYDLELAGFDPDNLRMDSASDDENSEFDREMALWKRNYLNGASVVPASRQPPSELLEKMERLEERIQQQEAELDEQQTRNHHLRQEVYRLQNLVKELEETVKKSEGTQGELEEQCTDYRAKMEDLSRTLTKLKVLYKDRTGLDADEDMAEGLNPRMYGTQRADRMKPFRYGDPVTTQRVRPSMPSNITGTVRRKIHVSVNLPQLNWTPLLSIESTLFEEFDPNSVLRQLDFTDFETKFQIVSREETQLSLDRRMMALQKSSERVTFVERNRAKNMIITKKKINLSSEAIRDAIERSDTTVLAGEYAEILMKYIPTTDEVKHLQENMDKLDNFDDAEMFLYHLARIERLESKLGTMWFMASFDDLITQIEPMIGELDKVSISVLLSRKLRSILEIVLAFGNYLNSVKRGFTIGFKIDSLAKLTEVKSRDKSVTLLHYIVHVVETCYPHLADFYTELDLDLDRTVSYQAVMTNLQILRKGMDIIKYELTNQPGNHVIASFQYKSTAALHRVQGPFHAMQDAFKDVCTLFGENFRQVEPSELFGNLRDFVSTFKRASDENYRRLHPPDPVAPRRTTSTMRSPPITPTTPIAALSPSILTEVHSNLRRVPDSVLQRTLYQSQDTTSQVQAQMPNKTENGRRTHEDVVSPKKELTGPGLPERIRRAAPKSPGDVSSPTRRTELDNNNNSTIVGDMDIKGLRTSYPVVVRKRTAPPVPSPAQKAEPSPPRPAPEYQRHSEPPASHYTDASSSKYYPAVPIVSDRHSDTSRGPLGELESHLEDATETPNSSVPPEHYEPPSNLYESTEDLLDSTPNQSTDDDLKVLQTSFNYDEPNEHVATPSERSHSDYVATPSDYPEKPTQEMIYDPAYLQQRWTDFFGIGVPVDDIEVSVF